MCCYKRSQLRAHCVAHLFDNFDANGSGEIDEKEIIAAFKQLNNSFTEEQIDMISNETNIHGYSVLDFDEFVQIANTPKAKIVKKLRTVDREIHGLSSVTPSDEVIVGDNMRASPPSSVSISTLMRGQNFAMELCESRVFFHLMQRFVDVTMASEVRDFFRTVAHGPNHSQPVGTTSACWLRFKERKINRLLKEHIQRSVT